MSASSLDIKNFIGGLQDLDKYRKFNWEGTFQQYVEMVREKPEITRNAFQRLYDLIVSYGIGRICRVQKEDRLLQFFQRPHRKRQRRHLRSGHSPDEAGECSESRSTGLWPGKAGDFVARSGGKLEEHHRPPDQKRRRVVFPYR